ncbi:MAG: low molecular weight phosphotyrosine protein phosphatase [Spirochaetia bacterium]|nr:low molecular weight phosphotyrosine protein phosphatase [Spirochaetia bacterium]
MKETIGVLFVCHGNICRSPAAEATFRHTVVERGLADHFEIDSAGTAGYHIGERAHATTRRVAEKHGIKITHRARQFAETDFDRFHYILAMDRFNFDDIVRATRGAADRSRIYMYRTFDPDAKPEEPPRDVPDPYYGEVNGFEGVQKVMIRTSPALLDWILAKGGQ